LRENGSQIVQIEARKALLDFLYRLQMFVSKITCRSFKALWKIIIDYKSHRRNLVI